MAERLPMRRNHSDPVERARSRTRESEDGQAAEGIEMSDIPLDAAPESGSHSNPTTPLPPPPGDERQRQRERHHVRFGPGGSDPLSSRHQPHDLAQAKPRKSNFVHHRTVSSSGSNSESSSNNATPVHHSPSASHHAIPSTSLSRRRGDVSMDITDSPPPEAASPPLRPASRRLVGTDGANDTDGEHNLGERAAQSARSRAEQLSKSLGPDANDDSEADSAKQVFSQQSPPPSPTLTGLDGTFIPRDMTPFLQEAQFARREYSLGGESDDEDEDESGWMGQKGEAKDTYMGKLGARIYGVARRVLRIPTPLASPPHRDPRSVEDGHISGAATPDRDRDPYYVPRPPNYARGVLSLLMDVYNRDGVGAALARHEPGIDYYRQRSGASTPTATPLGSPANSPPTSGASTPRGRSSKFFSRSPRASLTTLVQSSSTILSAPGASNEARPRPEPPRRASGAIETIFGRGRRDLPKQIRNQMQQMRVKQEYLIKSCKALMKYGAPTHRMEEYMRKSARKLLVEGQFLYLPGCMIISFDSPEIGTTEVKIVRENQAVDLNRLREIHDIYKSVIHDDLSARDAIKRLDEMMKRNPLYNKWVCIFFYGVASASVGPFGFGARPIDIPVAFVLGIVVGFLQLIASQKSESYLNVFEITAAVVTSMLARAFGSIHGGELFCFASLAQSAIALILPGFIVLSAALELQSRNMIAGSVRMVYAIIYSLFLGFGITVGVALYGWFDIHATQSTTCGDSPLSGYWKFAFVPIFTLSLCVVNQARWTQMPVMLLFSMVGYVVNFFSAQRFAGNNAQISNTLGALAVGLLGNLYSRLYQGMSAAAILPAIFVQVPSGIAAQGSLISGVVSANQLLKSNGTGVTTVSNGTQAGSTGLDVNNTVFNVGYTMIQIAVGLTVGLFFSSLLVYPLGKKHSGLFSF